MKLVRKTECYENVTQGEVDNFYRLLETPPENGMRITELNLVRDCEGQYLEVKYINTN